MGIKGLTPLLSTHAPDALSSHAIATLFNRRVAIDASMSIYQFLIAVRQATGEMLTNDNGEETSHLMGLFYRTIRMVENGIKVVYVFDGRPPDMKRAVLKERGERRKEAVEGGEEAKEVGTAEDISRFTRRTVKVTPQHNAECQRLLKLMGIPFVVAPSEAEAQCAELARGGKVYAAGSEDMDTLTFGSPTLMRHLTFSEAKKAPIVEVNLQKALEGLEMDMSTFIDLCILLGCDYLEPIKGVGPTTALKLLREHGSLKKIVKHLREKQAEREALAAEAPSDPESEDEDEDERSAVEEDDKHSDDDNLGEDVPATSDFDLPPTSDGAADIDMTAGDSDDDDAPSSKGKGKAKAPASDSKSKAKASKKSKPSGKKAEEAKGSKKGKGKGKAGITIPEEWPWEEAKKMFEKPDVIAADKVELEWKAPDVDGLVQFLVKDKGFNEDRVRKGAEKLAKFMNTKQQGRLDGFFTVKPKPKEPAGSAGKGKGKFKVDDKKSGAAKGKTGGVKRKGDAESGSKKKAKK
ncbi:Elongation of fatty acids protein 2 [Pleurotus pulmonarius]|nr:Elongation of fatty acids protein 2 [Pleurotus pulmonarius]KAF4591258.1 Elongation of fatty acids protein 2 [Pleurotus pulmonarius]